MAMDNVPDEESWLACHISSSCSDELIEYASFVSATRIQDAAEMAQAWEDMGLVLHYSLKTRCAILVSAGLGHA